MNNNKTRINIFEYILGLIQAKFLNGIANNPKVK